MRPEKQFIVDEIRSRVNASPFVLVTDYTGLKVLQFTELRTRLRAVQAECRVVKNTFLARVLKESGVDLHATLKGQTAVITGEKDVCAAAKILKNYIAEFKLPVLKGGILDKVILTKEQVMDLSDLPSKEVLQAKLLGLLQTPAAQLVRLLNTPASQLAQVIKAHAEKSEGATS
jgi:large subunit ribosomal protein L10